MAAYYNENAPYAVTWLRNLIAEGLIADGDVDERSIVEVRAADLKGYTQCHFFAGAGGWSHALRLAGWADDRPVWTGSCPCQPFSQIGSHKGFADERHLWPIWRELIRQCGPTIVFGEQSAKAAEWLGIVCGDMEAMEYAVGAVPIEAASIGAPHRRDRFWFVAHTKSGASGAVCQTVCGNGERGIPCTPSERGAWGPGGGGSPPRPESGGNRWPVEPDVCRVADGIPPNVAQVRALGNAIVPQIAAKFITAATEAIAT